MKKKEPLISVIIPTYNRCDTLERAIKSVLNQTYKNLEIIVVDDNANNKEFRNNTRELIKKYENIILVENKKNLGGGLTRNEGIKACSGELVAFLDDDDEYLPDKIKKQYELYLQHQNQNVGMIYCYANMVRVDGSSYINKNDLEGTPLKENINCCIAATSWWLCPKKALIDVGMFEDISSRQDASLLTKLLLKGYTVYRVPEVLLNYYWHNGTGISKINEKSIVAEKQFKKIFDNHSDKISLEEKNEIDFIFHARLAHLDLLLKNKKEAFDCLKKMCQLKKWHKKNLQMLFGVIFNRTYIYIARKKDIRRKEK